MISFPSFLSSLGENYIVSIIILKFAAWLCSTAISSSVSTGGFKKNFQIIPAPAALVKYLISAEKG